MKKYRLVKVHLLTTSAPIEYKENIINCYTKDGMYCVLFSNDNNVKVVHKYPINNIFRVVEESSKV
jgi:hypothetical protein